MSETNNSNYNTSLISAQLQQTAETAWELAEAAWKLTLWATGIAKQAEQGVELLKRAPGGIDEQNKKGYTQLHKAVNSEHFELAGALLEQGANPNIESNAGYTALHAAILLDSVQLVKLLLDSGKVDIEKRDRRGYTPLCIAVRFGHIEIARILLEKGACPNAISPSGLSVLHHAVYFRNLELVTPIVDGGADIRARTNLGLSAIEIATCLQLEDIFKYLKSKLD